MPELLPLVNDINSKVDQLLGGLVQADQGLAARVAQLEQSVFSGSNQGVIITSAALAEILRSTDFVTGVSGWEINKTGNAEFQNVTVRGTIYATAGEIGALTVIGSLAVGTGGDIHSGQTAFDTGSGFWLEYNAGTPRFSIGNSAGNKFVWDGATLAITGTFTATGGAVTGVLYVGASPNRVVLDGPNKLIKSENFIAGQQGWKVGGDDTAEFRDVTVRGQMLSTTVTYKELAAVGGSQTIVKSAGKLKSNVTTLTSPTTFNVDITDPPSGHIQLFAVGDILRLSEAGASNWLTVSSISDQTTFYRYVCTLSNGSPATWYAGAAVVDYGPSGAGGILLTADDTNAPFVQIFTHAGSPWSSLTSQVQLGNLKGWGSFVADTFGLAFGDFSGGNYMYFDPSAATVKFVCGGAKVIMDTQGVSILQGSAGVNQLKWIDAAGALIGYLQGRDVSALSLVQIVAEGNYASPTNTSQEIDLDCIGASGKSMDVYLVWNDTTALGSFTIRHDSTNLLYATSTSFDIQTGFLSARSDTDVMHVLGRVKTGGIATDVAQWSHFDKATGSDWALRQLNSGETQINAGSGQNINFFIAGSQFGRFNSSGQFVLAAGAAINEFSTDGTLAGNSDLAVPTEKAVKTYADGTTSSPTSFGLTQSGVVASTVLNSQMWTNGKIAVLHLQMQANAAGTAGNDIIVTSLPFSLPITTNQQSYGFARMRLGGTEYTGNLVPDSATAVKMRDATTGQFVGTNPSVALANNDRIVFSITVAL
jgi:hypothetical protein